METEKKCLTENKFSAEQKPESKIYDLKYSASKTVWIDCSKAVLSNQILEIMHGWSWLQEVIVDTCENGNDKSPLYIYNHAGDYNIGTEKGLT